MRQYAGVALVLMGLVGCQAGPDTMAPGPGASGGMPHGMGYAPPAVPGVQGPWGQKVAMCPPYNASPPGALAAMTMMNQSIPMDMVQMSGGMGPMGGGPNGLPPGALLPNTVMPAGGLLSPPGMPAAPGMPPGGGGLMRANVPPGAASGPGDIVQASYPPGAVAAAGALTSQIRFPTQRTQIRFGRPSGMRVSWYTTGADGKPSYSTTPIEAPGRYNFLQGAIYRLKLSNLEGRPGLELYPTLEVVPANPKTEAFLSHSAVPVDFTEEDFKQVAEGNYVVKVIYLPDPQYQELAGTGTEEILSTRLEPGADPIAEALRRGSILLVIRMGNMDQEAPNTPPISAGGPATCPPMGPMGMMPGMGGPMMPGMGGPPIMGGGPFRSPAFQIGPPPGPQMGGPPGGMPPGGMPPGMMPPGMMPPGMMPPGMMPPGTMPPGMPSAGMPPGGMPPGAMPPGAMPPGMMPPPGGGMPPSVAGPRPGPFAPSAPPFGPGGAVPPDGIVPGPAPRGVPSNSAGPSVIPEGMRSVPPSLLNSPPPAASPSVPTPPANSVPGTPLPGTPLPGAPMPAGPDLGPNTRGTEPQLPDAAPATPASGLGDMVGPPR